MLLMVPYFRFPDEDGAFGSVLANDGLGRGVVDVEESAGPVDAETLLNHHLYQQFAGLE